MKHWGYLFFIIAMTGCRSEPSVLFVPPGSENSSTLRERSFTGVDARGMAASLRQPETVKVYGVNRYVDAGDPRVMHERHAIYRLEGAPAWVTRSPKNRNEVILGPIVGLRRPEYAPEPMPGETARELVQARRGIQEANEGMTDLRDNQEKLAGNVASFAKETTDAQRKITTLLSALNQRVKRLEGGDGASVDEQTERPEAGTGNSDVVVRSPNP